MTLANSASVTLSPPDSRLADNSYSTASVALTPAASPSVDTAPNTLSAYTRLSGTERFDFIQAIYSRLGQTITDQAVGAQWSSLAHRLSCKVEQVRRVDRNGVIKDILTNQDTRFSRAYGELDANTRLAFWHRLFRSLNPYGHQHGFPSAAVQDLIAETERLGADQQLEFLTEAVTQMGV